MIDRVVIFGDSFNYGHGCIDRMFYYDRKQQKMIGTRPPENNPSEYCWGSLLQKEYTNIKVLNFANPGRSNAHIFRDYFHFCEHDDRDPEKTLIFFQLTNPDRIEIRHDEKKIESQVLSNVDTHLQVDVRNAIKGYIKYMYDDSIGTNNGYMTLLAALGLAMVRGYNFYWSSDALYYPPDTWLFIKKQPHVLSRNILDIRNMTFRMDLFKAIDNHINEKGHEHYYNKFIKPVLQRNKIVNT